MIKFVCNDHLHSCIGISSFYILYGQECRTHISLFMSKFRFEKINDMIKEMNEIRESVKLAMKNA